MKEILKRKYTRGLGIILRCELNTKNKITAIGALAVPVLKYSFGIINWRLEEIKKLIGKLERYQQCIKFITLELIETG
jgi:hypothetical protein